MVHSFIRFHKIYRIQNYQNKTESEKLQFAISICHLVDSRSLVGYTIVDMMQVLDLLERHELNNNETIVIYSANAHLVTKNFEPIDFILDELPKNAQLLVWTGHGELRVSKANVDVMKAHFIQEGTILRVAFDLKVSGCL